MRQKKPFSCKHHASRRQRGAAAVEFAFIAIALLTLLFGIIEFGRLFFNINSIQEITRRAAREQVVNWVSASDSVRCRAILQPDSCAAGTYFPGAIDITNNQVQLAFYNTYADAVSGSNQITYGSGSISESNFNNCLLGNSNCIRFVRAELLNGDALVQFNVLTAFMPSNVFPLPASTVIMPAEALGLL